MLETALSQADMAEISRKFPTHHDEKKKTAKLIFLKEY